MLRNTMIRAFEDLPKPPETFTKEQVEQLVAAERKKAQDTAQKTAQELEALKQKSKLTAEERTALEARIESLRTEGMSKEELARQEVAKAQKLARETEERLTAEAKIWRTKFETSTIKRDLTDAAASNKAYNPSQIVAILERDTRLVETLDEQGKPTGDLTVKTKLRTVDTSGKPIELELAPAEAVKKMAELPDFQNLFQGSGTGGLGNTGNSKGKTLADLAKSDPEAYRKARREGRFE
jgi:hypothetical protein